MKTTLRLIPLLLLLATVAHSRTITIFQQRQITIPVPEGWKFEESRDEDGVQNVLLVDPSEEIQLSVSFLPDQANRLATKGALEKQMRSLFQAYVAGSVEGEMKFTFSETADGLEGHTIFTDKRLAGRKIPPDERLNSTTGIRSWRGVFMTFTLLSNQTKSEAYKKALEIVRMGIREQKK